MDNLLTPAAIKLDVIKIKCKFCVDYIVTEYEMCLPTVVRRVKSFSDLL